MDNFDNFYNNNDNNEQNRDKPLDGDVYGQQSREEPRVIFQYDGDQQQPQDPNVKKYKKRNLILTVIAIVAVLAFILNIVVLAALKDEIASKFASNMSYQAQSDYQTAIDSTLSNTNIVDDVTDAATSQAIDRLNADIGAYVADMCLDSAVIINCTASGQSGTASGFLLNNGSTRYVLTNEHVVFYDKVTNSGFYSSTTRTPYTSIKCNFYDSSTEYSLSIVYYDADLDLALLTFSGSAPSATTHPAVKLASSDTLNYGEEIVLIGNPEGIGMAVTTGTVSIPKLSVEDWGEGVYVMTDAAVNPGNSGGPMLDKNGVCVGIVESKLVSSSIDNMGFAVSVETILVFLQNAEASKGISIGYTLA